MARRELTPPERAALEWMSKYVELTGRTIEWWWQFITEWAHLSMPLLLKNMPEEEVKKMAQLEPFEAAKIMYEKLATILRGRERIVELAEELANAKVELETCKRDCFNFF
ncbi:hypothetical protein PAE0073 [Pyrobaculum aerophilum str. IM2]|uniref:Uncharacterized protein n=2 Tax=Pyrobaculum aerophilum TaxID=13773 RepID=Q8ZZU7_PYRAE|nr:hypothetical protein [Pyrobaculum sp.]AAL62542.1 hypothetical protein PAE0073 [Pyrobaculum aerophilum str. IM2]